MHLLDAKKNKVELVEIPVESADAAKAAAPSALRDESPLLKAQRAFFELGRAVGPVREARAAAPARVEAPPTAFREVATGLVRTFHREVVMRFEKGVSAQVRRKLLEHFDLIVHHQNQLVADQVVASDRSRKRSGPELVEVSVRLAEADEIVFAAPNFVSEYHRTAGPPIAQWHLRNQGKKTGQVVGEDVDALDAWKVTKGARAIVVAVLDDGVDLEHPNLKPNVWRNPKKGAKDVFGRDFFLPDTHPDHFNPRPKKFRFPFDQMEGNDIHGTPCA